MRIFRMIVNICLMMLLISCKEVVKKKSQPEKKVYKEKINIDSLQQVLKDNISFISDSLLNGKKELLYDYLQKYQSDSCLLITYKNENLKSQFEGAKQIADIRGDKTADTVLVLPSFNSCDDGESYLFFDRTLPRLYTDSYCCHPDNLFLIGDINEDGVSEICIFYSACTSRFKVLIAYSLNNNQWEEVGRCTFDIYFLNPAKEKRVRKISKGKFEMLQIMDKAENKEWKQFSF